MRNEWENEGRIQIKDENREKERTEGTKEERKEDTREGTSKGRKDWKKNEEQKDSKREGRNYAISKFDGLLVDEWVSEEVHEYTKETMRKWMSDDFLKTKINPSLIRIRVRLYLVSKFIMKGRAVKKHFRS